MSLQVIDEDQFSLGVVYGTRQAIRTRWKKSAPVMCWPEFARLTDPTKPNDLGRGPRVYKMRSASRQTNPGTPSKCQTWDKENQKKVRDALILLGTTVRDTKRTFGTRAQVDPVRHLIGTADRLGLAIRRPNAFFISASTPGEKTMARPSTVLTVMDVPVDGFWSISVYNAEGYFQKNAVDAYSLKQP